MANIKKQDKDSIITSQLADLSEKISINNELIKMVLVNDMINSSAPISNETGLITYDCIDNEFLKKFGGEYFIEQYIILGKKCVFMIPINKYKMNKIHSDYCSAEEMGFCCVMVFQEITAYELKKCREFGINRVNLHRNSIEIKIN